MKKITILGGGENQLPLIKAAKEQGYYVVVIDFRGEVPGKFLADSFYMADATNFDEVLSICIKESIDGIISNSEYTVQVANMVATQLGLIGNFPDSINILMSKPDFRRLQHKLGHFAPKSLETGSLDCFLEKVKNMRFPIIVKPAESSGSRGVTIFTEFIIDSMTRCFEDCLQFSRNQKVVVEEYIKMPSLITIEGDVFLYKGKILWNGLYNTIRSKSFSVLPMTYSGPLIIDGKQLLTIKKTLEELFCASGVLFGQFNIEGYFTESNDFFVIEINARQGGNELPYFLKEFTGIDYNRLLVSIALGDDSYWDSILVGECRQNYCIQHSVFSYNDGIFCDIKIAEDLSKYVTKKRLLIRKGQVVRKCANGSDLIAIINFSFDNEESLVFYRERISEYINIILK